MNLNEPEVRNLINKWEIELRQIVGDDVTLTAFQPSKKIKFDLLKYIVCEVTGVTPERLIHRSRYQDQVQARHLVGLFAYEYLEMSLGSIATELHYKDHTSVLSGIRRLRGFIEIGDEQVCTLVNQIESEINKNIIDD